MVQKVSNESDSSSSLNLTAGQGVNVERNEIKVDPSSVTLGTEAQHIQTQFNTVQSTANTANSKADLLGTVQSGLVSNMNIVLPYYDTLYKATVTCLVSSRDNIQHIFHDKSAIWTNTKTGAAKQELPNGVHQLKLVTGATANSLLWEVMGMCFYVKNSNVNDPNYLPKTEIELSYFCHRNEISNDPVMKVHLVRTFGDFYSDNTLTNIRFLGIPLENESTTRIDFTLRKSFDLYQ